MGIYLRPLSMFGTGQDRRGERMWGSSWPGPVLKVTSRHLPDVTEEKPWKNVNQDDRRWESNPGLPNAKPMLYH
jgi:hypothetical protein